MSRFEGVCRGGPEDGRVFSSSGPVLRVPERIKFSVRLDRSDELTEKIRYSEYRWDYNVEAFVHAA